MGENVTRIHPAPSIPNPLMSNPWVALSDEEIDEGIIRAASRIDAAQHTIQSLTRERVRRALESAERCSMCRDGVSHSARCHHGEHEVCDRVAEGADAPRSCACPCHSSTDPDDDEVDESLDDCSACDAPLSSCARDAACCGDCTHGANFAPRPVDQS